MSLAQVARQYARALYAAAAEAGELPAVEDDMAVLDELLERIPGLAAWCQGHRREAGPSLVREAFVPFVGVLTARTLAAAAERGRLSIVPWLPEAFRLEAESKDGILRVSLECAQPPEPDLVERVQQHVVQRTGQHVSTSVTVVPELVAGFRVLWNDRMIDRSVRGRLGSLRARLISGAEP